MSSDIFRARLSAARRAAGLSKANLAATVGVSRSATTRWEGGDGYPDMDLMPRVALACQTTVDYLLGVDLLRNDAPAQLVDLAQAVGAPRVLYAGRPLSPDDRRRARTVLHGLLAPIDQVDEIPPTLEAPPNPPANPDDRRAQVLVNIPAKHPHKQIRRRSGDNGNSVGGGTA